MKKLLFLTGGPRFHPVAEQAQLIEGWLADEHGPTAFECVRLDGLFALEALDSSFDLLVVMGLLWPGMSADWAGKMAYTPMSTSHETALRSYIRSGKPILSHHGGIASYPECATFAEACGFAWIWGTTTHSPFGRWNANVIPGHPLTDGLQSFDVADEIYYRVKVLNPGETQVHASSRFEDQDHPMVSTVDRSATHGKRAYLANGHDLRAFAPPAMRRLWLNTLHWCIS